MSNQLLGVAVIKVDGQVLRSESGASCDVGGYTREDQPGARVQDSGFSEKAAMAMVDCVVMFDADTRTTPMKAWRDVTIVFECDTGQSYVLAHAWLKNTPKFTASGGKLPLQFSAPEAVEA